MSQEAKKLSLKIELIAETIDLKIDPEYQAGVEENFATLTEISKLVMEFPLDTSIEIAPKFEP